MSSIALASYVTGAIAALTFATALLGFLNTHRRLKSNNEKIQEVHVLVNSQLQAVVSRVQQLVNVLEHAGVPVPPNKNGEGMDGMQPH